MQINLKLVECGRTKPRLMYVLFLNTRVALDMPSHFCDMASDTSQERNPFVLALIDGDGYVVSSIPPRGRYPFSDNSHQSLEMSTSKRAVRVVLMQLLSCLNQSRIIFKSLTLGPIPLTLERINGELWLESTQTLLDSPRS